MEFIKKTAEQIVIAIPSKGRIQIHVSHFLESKGLKVDLETIGRKLQTHIKDHANCKVILMHPKDIPLFVERSVVDIGFTGLDLLHETEAKVRPLLRLGKGFVKMSLIVPNTSDISHPFHLMNKTVGTPFPNIAHNYFKNLKIPVTIETIQGASEGMPFTGVVDAIVDVVESGATINENHLRIIDSEIFDSECVCIVNQPEFKSNYQAVNQFLRRIYT